MINLWTLITEPVCKITFWYLYLQHRSFLLASKTHKNTVSLPYIISLTNYSCHCVRTAVFSVVFWYFVKAEKGEREKESERERVEADKDSQQESSAERDRDRQQGSGLSQDRRRRGDRESSRSERSSRRSSSPDDNYYHRTDRDSWVFIQVHVVSRHSFISCLPWSVSIWTCGFVLCCVFSVCCNPHSSWIAFICPYLPFILLLPSFFYVKII